jgi:hypothetical protein
MSTLDERREHLVRIDKIRDDFLYGKITYRQKRELIERENEFFYGDHPRSLTAGKIQPEPERVLVPAASPPYTDDEPERYWWEDK